ncbi:hypothetical protein SAMN02982927_03433 [Sporolactobacillus nakayamae]|uniref:Uncharacterized protein n=1 Tax=Sporolactobacillus nakayamae TaxID=269670 RepID=A0A1I2WAP9_9BACL|nr:hypothetical protein SAMN02982927_03433 [Sporolactobacillus nakayamae]
MLYHLNHWHGVIVQKIAVTFSISKDMHHHLPHQRFQRQTKTKNSGVPRHYQFHRTIHWHHPYRNPMILKGVQYWIGNHMENKFRKF